MTNEQIIWDYLINQGFTPAGAAGLIGNLYAESGLNPKNMENAYERKLNYTDDSYTAAVDNGSYTSFTNDAAGYGLAQWTYSTRKKGLLDLAKSKNTSIGDINTQLEYLYKELKNSFPQLFQLLQNSNDISETTIKVLTNFERPANMGESVQKQRIAYAQGYYDKLNTVKGVKSNMATAEDVLNVARSQLGYHEKKTNSSLDNNTANSGSNNWTKYARDLASAGYYNGNKNGYAWCDVFTDWCFWMACNKSKKDAEYLECQTGDCGAGCDFSASYYKNAGRFSTTPQVGDQIFFKQGSSIVHTGIVESVTSSTVNTIEGNTSDQVARRSYSRNSSQIYGYGHPRYNGSSTGVTPPASQPGTSNNSKKDNIKKFQTWLNTNYKANIDVDGEWGPKTKKATIKAYQTYMNTHYNSSLDVDGEWGPLSKAAIKKYPLKLNAKNDLVYILQGALQALGYDTNGLDGEYGTSTKAAVKSYQSSKGLLADGEAGADTFNALFK